MTQDKETLREAVARAMRLSAPELQSGQVWAHITVRQSQVMADAAIATMFERLRTPSEVAVFMGVEQWCQQPDDPDADVIGIWQAMLAAFQQENSDA